MKQFILATDVSSSAYAVGDNATANKLFIDSQTGSDLFTLTATRGANVPVDVYTLYRKNLSYTKTTYTAGATFSQTVTIPTSPVDGASYVLQIVKKGEVFNERNVWTTSVIKTATNNTGAKMAKQLAKQINTFGATAGLKATVNNNVVTVTADAPGVDYKIDTYVDAPEGVTATAADLGSKTAGKVGIADTAWVKELAHKCMGDKGASYTASDSYLPSENQYNSIASAITATSYVIFNVRVYNPRHDHRVDEPLYQMIHIAVPSTKTDAISALENVLKDVDSSNEQTDKNAPSA